MREIDTRDVTEKVKELCIAANYELGKDMLEAFEKAMTEEESPVGKDILKQLVENVRIARQDQTPICQDTGYAVVFLEVGQDVHFVGGDVNEAIHEGVRQGYRDGYLRKSTCHPFTRANRGDNTPAIIHVEMVPGDRVKITVAPKGAGSENMSRVDMLTPAVGIEGIKDFVVNRVRASGANPCPPTVVGVGIGGTFEQTALIAKKALLRRVGEPNPDPELAAMEEDLLTRINRLGIGPQGLGGRTTSLAVHVNMMPSHIASLPVAVNIQCHVNRHKEAVL